MNFSILKEEGHYFPQSSHQVPGAKFFIAIYFKNYGSYSYDVNCFQIAFLMLFSNPERLGRCNLFWAEEGRNFKPNVSKMFDFSLFWALQSDFGPT